MMWGKPRAEDGRAYVGTRAPTCYSSSSLGLAVKSPWPRKPQARAHRPRRSCLLVSSLRMRSTAVGVRMRAALPRARACAHRLCIWSFSRDTEIRRRDHQVGLKSCWSLLESMEATPTRARAPPDHRRRASSSSCPSSTSGQLRHRPLPRLTLTE